jgi:UDP-2,3-diacylglucosamine pyrophosphatase LpxH
VVPRDTERRFREFLGAQRERAAAVLINGDLFDVWLATRHFVSDTTCACWPPWRIW